MMEEEAQHPACYGLYRAAGIASSTSGAYTGCRRLAPLGGLRAAVATGRKAFLCDVDGSTLHPYTREQVAEQRRTGLVRPLPISARVTTLIEHGAEVVDVVSAPATAGSWLLATTDARGDTIITRLSNTTSEHTSTVALGARGGARASADCGRCAAAFSPDTTRLARLQKQQHCVDVLDTERACAVRRIRPLACPTQVAYLPDGMLAVAEGVCVALYDVREASSAPTVRVEAAARPAELLCLQWAPRLGWLLAAGEDRCVSAIDVAAGGVAARWPACTQLTVCFLLAAHTGPVPRSHCFTICVRGWCRRAG